MTPPHPTATALLDQLVTTLDGGPGAALLGLAPAAFAATVLGQTLWQKQLEALALLEQHDRVTIRSSHGIGKTFLAACASLWWVYSHRPSLVLTTAPTQRQVEGLLWGEINRLWRAAEAHQGRALPGRCMLTKLNASPDQQALGLTTREPERFAGWHNEHILVIVDEASGVPDAIYEVIQGTLTSAHCRLLLIGNPTRAEGYFHASHHAPGWQSLKVAAQDTPNFAPGIDPLQPPCPWLVTPRWVADRLQEWGPESAPYRVRVLAEFPRASADSLVALEWLEAAEQAGLEASEGQQASEAPETVLGLDVARYGDCETVLAVRRGPHLLAMEGWPSADLMTTTGRLVAACREWQGTTIVIDAVGMGAGPLDRLRELQKEGQLAGVTLIGFESGQRARDPVHYASRRDEAYWRLREGLRQGNTTLARPWEKLTGQLCALRYRYSSRGQVQIETKEELRRRGIPSPDWADAAVLAFADTAARKAWIPRALGSPRKGNTLGPLP